MTSPEAVDRPTAVYRFFDADDRNRLSAKTSFRGQELVVLAVRLGVSLETFLPMPKPPDPMGEGRTSGLVDAAPPLRATEAPGVPALAPGADAFSLPAPPALPRFAVGTALYDLPGGRRSRA